MSGFLRILLVIAAVSLLIFMMKRIRQAKLKIEYAVFWMIFSVVLVIMGAVPKLFYAISDFIGFQSPISMVFLVVIFILIIKIFFMTLTISNLENKVDSLAQQIAISKKIEKEMNHKENGDQ